MTPGGRCRPMFVQSHVDHPQRGGSSRQRITAAVARITGDRKREGITQIARPERDRRHSLRPCRVWREDRHLLELLRVHGEKRHRRCRNARPRTVIGGTACARRRRKCGCKKAQCEMRSHRLLPEFRIVGRRATRGNLHIGPGGAHRMYVQPERSSGIWYTRFNVHAALRARGADFTEVANILS